MENTIHLQKQEGERDELEAKFVRRIKQTQLTINIIDPASPDKVKYDIFKRVNSGGRHLNSQEIRNCMARPEVRKFIKELAGSDDFKQATRHSVNDNRMAAQKLIMRFIGFYYLWVKEYENLKYSSDIEDFLNKTLEIFNNSSTEDKDKIGEYFRNAMKNAQYLFGEYAFCKILSTESNQRNPLINKSLFTTWSVFLSSHSPSEIKTMFSKKALVAPLAQELEKKARVLRCCFLGNKQ